MKLNINIDEMELDELIELAEILKKYRKKVIKEVPEPKVIPKYKAKRKTKIIKNDGTHVRRYSKKEIDLAKKYIQNYSKRKRLPSRAINSLTRKLNVSRKRVTGLTHKIRKGNNLSISSDRKEKRVVFKHWEKLEKDSRKAFLDLFESFLNESRPVITVSDVIHTLTLKDNQTWNITNWEEFCAFSIVSSYDICDKLGKKPIKFRFTRSHKNDSGYLAKKP